MTVTEEPKRKVRTKAEQIVDIIRNMTPRQVDEFAVTWVEREPEHLNRFQRALREMSESDNRIHMEGVE